MYNRIKVKASYILFEMENFDYEEQELMPNI